MRSLPHAVMVAACLAAFSMAPVQASAAPTPAELNAARETYREGVALESAGNWAGALAKFREVAAIKSTARVRFHIGLCQENIGRWNEAVGAYKMALVEAEKENAKDVMKEAEAARAKLESRIPRLTVRKGPGAESATVSLDGVELGSAMLGTEMPVDPGTHTVETALPGRSPKRTTVEVREGEKKTVDATLPAEAAPAPAVAAVPSAVRPEPQPPTPKSSKVVPWIITGAGAASLAASGVFYFLRQGVISDLENTCGAELRCSEAERSTYDKGKTYTTIANVTLGVGIVGVGVGTVLLLSGGKKEASPAAASARTGSSTSVGMTFHPSGVNLVGRF